MTETPDFELRGLATPYALHAVSDDERAAIDRQLAAAPPSVAEAFRDEVRAVHETMTAVSATTSAEPPTHLRATVLAAVQPDTASSRSRWRTAVLAGAAAIAVGLGAFRAGIAMRPSP